MTLQLFGKTIEHFTKSFAIGVKFSLGPPFYSQCRNPHFHDARCQDVYIYYVIIQVKSTEVFYVPKDVTVVDTSLINVRARAKGGRGPWPPNFLASYRY